MGVKELEEEERVRARLVGRFCKFGKSAVTTPGSCVREEARRRKQQQLGQMQKRANQRILNIEKWFLSTLLRCSTCTVYEILKASCYYTFTGVKAYVR